MSNDHRVQPVYILYHKKKQEIQPIFLSHGYLILMEMQKDRLVHDQWKENKFQNHKYLVYFYMQVILYGHFFLIVILNSMTMAGIVPSNLKIYDNSQCDFCKPDEIKGNPWYHRKMINKEGGIETMDLNKLKEIQAVVFDMDGLMFDSERYVQKSWDIAGERLGYGPLGHNIVNTLGTNLTNRKKYFLEHYGNDFPFDKFLDGYRDAYYELVEDGVPAKKGLHEILKVLREKGLKIGVATSSSEEHAVSNLKREGIFDYFDSVITGNMIEHGKPEPDIYIEACRQLKVDPSKAIALEDAINGIRSAHGAGMNPVMIPDIVQDTSKVDDILFGKCESLLEFAEILQGVTLDIEETQKYGENIWQRRKAQGANIVVIMCMMKIMNIMYVILI